MNLRDLDYFVAVAEEGHFGRAAERCHVSQPTLSMQLKKLEEEIGAPLIERAGRRMMLTEAGSLALPRAREVLRAAQDIRDIARAASDPFSGQATLGAFPTLAPYLFPRILPALAEAFPRAPLYLIEEKTAALVERLRGGALDAALLALPVEADGLHMETLFDDPFLLAVPRAHPLATRKTVEEKDIHNETLLLLEEGHCLRAQALSYCTRGGFAPSGQDFRATSLETLRQMVGAGLGVTFMPKLAVPKEKDGLSYLSLKPTPSRRIGLAWRESHPRAALFLRMAETMRMVMKKPG